MSDLFDDINKIFKKDLFPNLVKYLKDPNNKIPDYFNQFLNDPQILINKIVEKFSQNIEHDNNLRNCTNIDNVTDIDLPIDDEYDELVKKLILIEENMVLLQKILKDKK